MGPSVVFLLGLVLFSPAFAAGQAQRETYHQFAAPVSDEATVAGLDAATAQAGAEGKLLMVVMGANWCHDSRAFIDRMAEPAFSGLIDERFVVYPVNIGYFEHIRGVVARWDVPVIYGTPTVLVVEPSDNRVLNRPSLAYWRNAAAISLADTLSYFSRFSATAAAQDAAEAEPESPALREALAAIDQFERQQAERIYAGYAVLGPMLQQYDAGEDVPEFMDKWDSLATMRGSLGDEIPALRASAQAEAMRGVQHIQLVYPVYPLFLD